MAEYRGATTDPVNGTENMNRIQPLDPASATGESRRPLAVVQSKLGIVPNLTRVLAHAPAALDGYLSFSGALAGGSLAAKVREQISLTVAESNLCGYGLSMHAFIGGTLGLTADEIADARHANAATGKTDAVLKLARSVVMQRGEISDADLASARASGVTDEEIVETVANVALNIFTNYMNHVARTVVDFPDVKPGNGYPPRRASSSGS